MKKKVEKQGACPSQKMNVFQLLPPRSSFLNLSSFVCGSVLASDFYSKLENQRMAESLEESIQFLSRGDTVTAAVKTQEKKQYSLKGKK